MTEEDARDVLGLALELAAELKTLVLVGVLRTDIDAMCEAMGTTMATLHARSGTSDALKTLEMNRVAGFAVCPPSGASLAQAEIEAGLSRVLSLGLPTALYQLPQITKNEMAPLTVERLAGRFANLVLVKDTSGADAIARASVLDGSGVFLVRGFEGDYATWLKSNRGPYDGLLLSTANNFAPQLDRIVRGLASGAVEDAVAVSERLSRTVDALFELVAGLDIGNAYTNANKAADHFMAHGRHASLEHPPCLRGGVPLPGAVLAGTRQVLDDFDVMPAGGYLELHQ